uniref:Nuclear receptor domain-containing protein n=1 Tax=Meloidogyne hapla TaxID=6305 RepID=A0A1I8BJ72_MELHA
MTTEPSNKLNNEGEEDSPRCAVCSDKAQGLHFGVMVCRACAAFFRRSTIAKRVYQCRYNGNCQINFREVRCSCRACRFARCISLGMDPNAVQKHRDQLGPRKTENNKIIKKGQKQQIKNEENINLINNNNSLLTPINIMNAMQLQLLTNNKLEEEKHLEENGRSYTLLSGVKQFNNNSYLIENKGFTDTLLQALPSAFSPIQKQQKQHSSSTDITTTNIIKTTTTLDSGNVSATSSVLSSPLNPGSVNGRTNVRE